MTTRPYMEKCVNELGVTTMYVKKSQCYDKLTRCPLNSEHVHWFHLHKTHIHRKSWNLAPQNTYLQ